MKQKRCLSKHELAKKHPEQVVFMTDRQFYEHHDTLFREKCKVHLENTAFQ